MKYVTKYGSILFLTIFYCFSVYYFFNFFRADMLLKLAKQQIKTGNVVNSYLLASRAIEKNPNEPTYYRQRAHATIALALSNDLNIAPRDLKKLALDDLYTSEKLNPKNYATLRDNLPLYYFLAASEVSQPVAYNTDKYFLSIAQDYLEYLKQNFPNDVGLWVEIAKYEKNLDLEKNYKKTLTQIRMLRPDILEWHESIITP